MARICSFVFSSTEHSHPHHHSKWKLTFWLVNLSTTKKLEIQVYERWVYQLENWWGVLKWIFYEWVSSLLHFFQMEHHLKIRDYIHYIILLMLLIFFPPTTKNHIKRYPPKNQLFFQQNLWPFSFFKWTAPYFPRILHYISYYYFYYFPSIYLFLSYLSPSILLCIPIISSLILLTAFLAPSKIFSTLFHFTTALLFSLYPSTLFPAFTFSLSRLFSLAALYFSHTKKSRSSHGKPSRAKI